MSDPRAVESPEVLHALLRACAAVRTAADPRLLELARIRLAQLLGAAAEAEAPPWGPVTADEVAALATWPTRDEFDDRDRAALALVEQFAIDVTAVPEDALAPAVGALSDGVLPFVQGLYLLDVGQRVAVVLSRVLDAPVSSGDWAWPTGLDASGVEPMTAIMDLLAAVGRCRRVDPVTKELVRLRGARVHDCRRCRSVRNVAAIAADGDGWLLGADDPSSAPNLTPATQAAVDLVDATFVGRPVVDDELVDRLRRSFDVAELVELGNYMLRNASNKIAVAFGADDAIVESGFEYQIIDEDGATITVDGPSLEGLR